MRNDDPSSQPTPAHDRRRRVIAGLVFAASVAVVAYRLLGGGNPWVLIDFRSNLYYPTRALLDGNNPYDVADLTRHYPITPPLSFYAPLALVTHAPLALLPVAAAGYLYIAISIGLAAVISYVTLRAARVSTDAASVLALTALVVASRPGTMSLLLGQPTMLIVLGAYVALLGARTRPVWAAIGVAITTFKPQFGVPLAVMLAAAGTPGVAAAGLLISAGVGVVTIVAIARGNLHLVPELIVALPRQAIAIDGASTLSWWSRVDIQYLVSHVLGQRLPPFVTFALAVLVLGVAVASLRRTATTADADRTTTITCLAVLVCLYHHAYDSLLLILPVALLLADWRRRPRPELTMRRALLLALLLCPAVNFLATATMIEHFGISGLSWTALTAVNGLALLVALLAFVATPFFP